MVENETSHTGQVTHAGDSRRLGVLISGRGSNLQAMIAADNNKTMGMTNRSLLRLPTAICPVGWLLVGLSLKMSSATDHRFTAEYVYLDAAAMTRVHVSIDL